MELMLQRQSVTNSARLGDTKDSNKRAYEQLYETDILLSFCSFPLCRPLISLAVYTTACDDDNDRSNLRNITQRNAVKRGTADVTERGSYGCNCLAPAELEESLVGPTAGGLR